MKVLAFTGVRGSGKDYAADIIKRCWPQLYIHKIAFADPIREAYKEMLGLTTDDDYHEVKRLQLGVTVNGRHIDICGRNILKNLGMRMRGYDVNQFTDYVEQSINDYPEDVWLITDLRFDNEMEMCKRVGATIVKIDRSGFVSDGHVTERGFPDDQCSVIIKNDGTIQEFERKVKAMFDNYLYNEVSSKWDKK